MLEGVGEQGNKSKRLGEGEGKPEGTSKGPLRTGESLKRGERGETTALKETAPSHSGDLAASG